LDDVGRDLVKIVASGAKYSYKVEKIVLTGIINAVDKEASSIFNCLKS